MSSQIFGRLLLHTIIYEVRFEFWQDTVVRFSLIAQKVTLVNVPILQLARTSRTREAVDKVQEYNVNSSREQRYW